jgi:hypothetical protein
MRPSILVVARNGELVNRFGQGSMLEALNIKDFLEDTGDYQEVAVFQLLPTTGHSKEWVKLSWAEA